MTVPTHAKFAWVKYNLLAVMADTSDPDRDPDFPPISTATVNFRLSSVRNLDAADKITFLTYPVDCTFATTSGTDDAGNAYVAGDMLDGQGNLGVKVLVPINPPDATYIARVTPNDGKNTYWEIPFLATEYQSPGDEIDLTDVSPIPSSGGTPIVQGPPGPAWLPRGDWDPDVDYSSDPRSDLVLASDGLLYAALQPSTRQDPTSTSGYWMQIPVDDPNVANAFSTGTLTPVAAETWLNTLTTDDWSNLQTSLNVKVPNTRTISGSGGISGGGDLSANRTLTIADAALTVAKTNVVGATEIDAFADGDELLVYDLSANANKKGLLSSFWTYIQGKLAGFITNSHISASAAIALTKIASKGGSGLFSGNSTHDDDMADIDAALGGAWSTYTPTFTNVTAGAGSTTTGRYKVIGKTLLIQVYFHASASTSYTGSAATLSLPSGLTTGSMQQLASMNLFNGTAYFSSAFPVNPSVATFSLLAPSSTTATSLVGMSSGSVNTGTSGFFNFGAVIELA